MLALQESSVILGSSMSQTVGVQGPRKGFSESQHTIWYQLLAVSVAGQLISFRGSRQNTRLFREENTAAAEEMGNIKYSTFSYMLPLATFVFWTTFWVGLLLIWLFYDRHNGGYRQYNMTVMFIDNPAQVHKPFAIALGTATAAAHSSTLWIEQFLRHAKFIHPAVGKSPMIALAGVLLGIIGSFLLILMLVFDMENRRTLHWALMFGALFALDASAVCQSVQVYLIAFSNPAAKSLRLWARVKISLVVFMTILNIFLLAIFLTKGGYEYALDIPLTSSSNILNSSAAGCQWVIAFLFSIYFFTVIVDIWPSKTPQVFSGLIQKPRRRPSRLEKPNDAIASISSPECCIDLSTDQSTDDFAYKENSAWAGGVHAYESPKTTFRRSLQNLKPALKRSMGGGQDQAHKQRRTSSESAAKSEVSTWSFGFYGRTTADAPEVPSLPQHYELQHSKQQSNHVKEFEYHYPTEPSIAAPPSEVSTSDGFFGSKATQRMNERVYAQSSHGAVGDNRISMATTAASKYTFATDASLMTTLPAYNKAPPQVPAIPVHYQQQHPPQLQPNSAPYPPYAPSNDVGKDRYNIPSYYQHPQEQAIPSPLQPGRPTNTLPRAYQRMHRPVPSDGQETRWI